MFSFQSKLWAFGTRLSISLAIDEIKLRGTLKDSYYPEREDAARTGSGHQCPFHDHSGQI